MMTVFKYGFSEPVVEAPKPQGPGIMTYALIAGVVYWAYTKGWLTKLVAKAKSAGGVA